MSSNYISPNSAWDSNPQNNEAGKAVLETLKRRARRCDITEEEWIKLIRSLKGKSDISEWNKVFSITPAGINYVKIVLDRGMRGILDYFLPVPANFDEETRGLVARYLAVFINNSIVKWSARRVGILTSDGELVCMVNQYFDEEYGDGAIKEMMRRYYNQSEPFVIERIEHDNELAKVQQCIPEDSLPIPKTTPISVGSKVIMGINIGQFRVRIGFVQFNEAGAITDSLQIVNIETWPSGCEKTVSGLFNRIKQCADRLIADSYLKIDGIGISVAARAEGGKALGIPLGVAKNFLPAEMQLWAEMDSYFSEQFGDIPVFIENDATAQAVDCSKSGDVGNLLVIRFGTTLSSAYIDQYGRILPGFNEISRTIIDMYDSIPTDRYYRRRAGNYISYRGIIHVSKSLGLFEKYGFNETDVVNRLRKMLESGSEEETRDAQSVYQEIGHRIVEFIRELLRDYRVQTVILIEGTPIAGRPMEEIRQVIIREISDSPDLGSLNVIVKKELIAGTGSVIGVAYKTIENIQNRLTDTPLQPVIAGSV